MGKELNGPEKIVEILSLGAVLGRREKAKLVFGGVWVLTIVRAPPNNQTSPGGELD